MVSYKYNVIINGMVYIYNVIVLLEMQSFEMKFNFNNSGGSVSYAQEVFLCWTIVGASNSVQ